MPSGMERLFALFVLFFATGAFWSYIQGSRDPEAGVWLGSLVTNGLWVACYAIAFFLIRSRCVVPKGMLKDSMLMLLPVPIAFISLLWSDDRMLTLLRSMALLGTSIVALYLALRFTIREIVQLLAAALSFTAITSFLMATLLPKYGIDQYEFQGIWLGAFTQKNALGGTMVVACLVLGLMLWWERSHRLWRFSVLLLSLFLIVKADSMASLGVCCVLPYLMWVSRKSWATKGHYVGRVLSLAVPVLIVIVVTVTYFDQLLDMIGRDANLTGRTLLWALVMQAISQRPYVGYGYEAFWRGYEGTAGEIWQQMNQFQFYSHNGFLEVMLGLGLAGLVAILIALVIFGKRSLQRLQGDSLATAWPWAFFLYLILSNLLEGSLMKSNTLPWMLYTVTALSLSVNRLRTVVQAA